MLHFRSTLLLIALVDAVPAVAAPAERSRQFRDLVECRALADATARLACYDSQVAALDQAEAKRDIVIVDREQVRQTKRTLFGLALPKLALFSRDDDDKDEIKQIESKLAWVRQDPYGFTMRLEDGSTWQQSDGAPFYKLPKPGLPVVVRRGALTSYFMRVDGAPGVKVKRVL